MVCIEERGLRKTFGHQLALDGIDLRRPLCRGGCGRCRGPIRCCSRTRSNNRSILFWKSLPVSDLTTVLAKASIPILLLPLLTFAITVARQWCMVLLTSAALLTSGMSMAAVWPQLHFARMWAMLLFHLVAVHGLWYSPYYGWLFLVSAWARRLPVLWAVLPVVAIAIIEKIAFNSAHFATMVMNRLGGGPAGGASGPGTAGMDAMGVFPGAEFLVSPGLWVGLPLTASMLTGAVRLRHYREPV